MFLKKNTNKNHNTSDITVKPLSNESENAIGYKSILRDTSLTDARKRPDSKVSDHETEDRKIVRFNFDASEETSGDEADNDAWDFEAEQNFVKDVKVTINKNSVQSATELSDSHQSTSTEPTISGNILPSIFDRKMEQDKRIKPLYEDTDSESVASVKSFNREFGELSPKKSAMPQSGSDLRAESKNLAFQREDFGHYMSSNIPRLEFKKEMAQEELNLRQAMADELADLKAKIIEKNKSDLADFEHDLEKKKPNDFESDGEKINIIDKLNDNSKVESEHNVWVEQFNQKLEDEFAEKHKTIIKMHRIAEEKLQENHKIILEELERDLKSEEDLIKKDHAATLRQMREKLTHELELERQRMRETGENRLYEKIRCEKRLLEDKYRCLKDKYVRLKTDVKISLERRNQRRELQTGIEPSKSYKKSSDATFPVPPKNEDTGKPPALLTQRNGREPSHDENQDREKIKNFGAAAKYLSHIQQQYQDDTTSFSQSDTTVSNNYRHRSSELSAPAPINIDNSALQLGSEKNNNHVAYSRHRKKIFTRSASTSRINFDNSRISDEQIRSDTPVENLRWQLQKLEDLEDQFPENSFDTTYHLRYPFKVDNSNEQPGGYSSELEFFKHRIHLERDSVRRAKDSLRSQRTDFRTRQKEVKIHQKNAANHTIDQMTHEEKELTEMEVNLHRTRALLGEKVIRLRHLEQALQRMLAKNMRHLISEEKDNIREDAIISDLSSHSSSGFSSTDFVNDTQHGNVKRREMYHKSTEVMQSLVNLNDEIRDIWEILSKQQSRGMYSYSQRNKNNPWIPAVIPKTKLKTPTNQYEAATPR